MDHIRQPTLQITLNDGGFTPAEVTIKQGTKVTFKNTGTVPHWPASNIHPTHEIYPEFDPMRELAPGESWSFIFDKAGKWHMHDHLAANSVGTITVTAVQSSDVSKNTPNKLAGNLTLTPLEPEKATTIDLKSIDMLSGVNDPTKLDFYLRALGPKVVMKEIIADSQSGSVRDCHAEAHKVGRVAFELYGQAVFGVQDAASCHSGFYHGAMEAFLAKSGTDNLAQKIEAVCQQFPTSFGIFECLHGVGHGVMAFENYDLPEALKTCDSLSANWDKNACYGGVFMENIVAGQGHGATTGHDTKWLSKDPHFPCNSVGSDYAKRYQCYQMQTSWMLSLNSYDFAKVGRECTKSPADMIDVCFKSLGRDAAGNSLRDPAKILKICNSLPNSKYFDTCIEGAVNVIIDFWGGELSNQASGLCTILPADHKKACFSIVASRITDITNDPQKQTVICNSIDKEYQSLCKK
jgi:plastocyanin